MSALIIRNMFGMVVIFAAISNLSAQQLKPTEIIYSRMPNNVNAPPTGSNQPTIWVVGQDGSNDRFITNGTAPRISDDGRFLLFKRFTRHPSFYNPFGGYADFYTRELATGNETLILSINFDQGSWGHFFSPESNQGNYEIIADDSCLMYKFHRNGTGITFLYPTSLPAYCADDFPVVRRGGDQLIAFHNLSLDTINGGGLFTVGINGLGRQKIPNTNCGDINAAWSNDSQFIGYGNLFQVCGSFPQTAYPYFVKNLWKIKADGTGKQQLTNFSAGDCSQASTNCLTFGMVWTENNSKLIAAGRVNGIAGLYAFNTDGSAAFSQIPISAGNAPEFVGGIVQPRVEQNVVSAGGGPVSGGNYTLVSTIGEAVAGITSTGGQYSFSSGFWATLVDSIRHAPFDFDGDGKTDVGIFRPAVGEWWIYRSLSGSTFAAQFGASTDRIVPSDYTGDGKTDIAFWRPSTGEWYVLRSENNSFYSVPFGAAGDIPAPADYDSDGKSDTAVFRPSSGLWFIQRSTAGTLIQQFGANGDQPIAADYDGDGKADIGIYRASVGEWWINRSTAGTIAFGFGNSADRIVPGDYTGDGKADVAFWRPSTGEWFILRSEDSSYYSAPFGSSGDLPTPGDYDGDGKFDIAVFRPAGATWFVQRTSAGTLIQQFGSNGDQPVANAFVR